MQKQFPLSRIFPNMVTVAGLCCGLSAVRFALMERWEIVIALVLAAGIIDALDGLAARLLKATSQFGAQLDSLSDIISFGVSPALVMYLWVLQDKQRYGWAAALFFVVCCALRLARFNASIIKEGEPKPAHKRFFTGIPAPAGALLATAPITLSLEQINWFADKPMASSFYLIIIALLMASRIPTFSFKQIRISQPMILPVMMVVSLYVATFFIEPWIALLFTGAVYVACIPWSAWLARK